MLGSSMPDVRIRDLTLDDLDRIHAIDRKVTGSDRSRVSDNIWNVITDSSACLGAEVEEELVGFMLGDVRPWEFGIKDQVGWIVALGVDPDHQGKGIGRLLGEEAVARFRKLGCDIVKTMVEAKDSELVDYFESLGFETTEARVLELA